MRRKLSALILLLTLLLPGCKSEPERAFERALRQPWRVAFADDLTAPDTTSWHLDGLQGRMVHTPEGLELYAGRQLHSDSSHVVLWTRRMFRGDLRIEYDYTRLDSSRAESVNILYLHATGSGCEGFDRNIMAWNDRRKIPAMRTYFDNMNLYHISYAVARGDTLACDYVRVRRYMPDAGQGLQGTALRPEYGDTGLFLPGVKYRITVVKSRERLFMQAAGGGMRRLFTFDLEPLPSLDEGFVGFRMMWGRAARYGRLRIYESKH